METGATVDNLMTFLGYTIGGFTAGQLYSQNLDPVVGLIITILALGIGARNHYNLRDEGR